MKKEVVKMLPSQCGQDKFLVENIFKEKRNGFFVDVGAHDGVYISNTAVFEKEYSWSGICIEPSQASRVLIGSRPNSKVVVCCVGEEGFSNEIIKFIEIDLPQIQLNYPGVVLNCVQQFFSRQTRVSYTYPTRS